MGIAFGYYKNLHLSAASWSYSGFNAFRGRLATAANIDLADMVGFGGDSDWDTGDPIELLLNHSDCDGDMIPDHCEQVAPRLEELIADWADDYDKRMATALVETMRECADAGRNLIFC